MPRRKMIESHSHTFDTYKNIKALVKSGFKEKQAEGIVNSLVESRDYDLSKLVTKDTLKIELHATKEELRK